jgi:hypothetical protein
VSERTLDFSFLSPFFFFSRAWYLMTSYAKGIARFSSLQNTRYLERIFIAQFICRDNGTLSLIQDDLVDLSRDVSRRSSCKWEDSTSRFGIIRFLKESSPPRYWALDAERVDFCCPRHAVRQFQSMIFFPALKQG